MPRVLCAAACALLIVACPSDDPLEAIRTLNAEGRHLEAIEQMDPLLEAGDVSPELQLLYGVACARTGRWSAAIGSLRRAREDANWALPAGIELARAGLESGDLAIALEAANRVLDLQPGHADALAVRDEVLRRGGGDPSAQGGAGGALAAGAAEGELQLLRLNALLERGELDAAGGLVDELESRAAAGEIVLPAPRYCLARADLASRRGESAEAEARFEACVAEFPTSAVVMQASLAFFDAHGDPERSVRLLREVLEREPRASAVRHVLAVRLRERGDVDLAERLLLQGTELEPPAVAAEAWRSLAGHHLALQDRASAAASWDRYMALVPEPSDEVRLEWVEALASSGRFGRALAIAPTLSDRLRPLAMGRIRFEQHRPGEALAHFEEAILARPDDPVVRYHAARSAERAGDFDRAAAEYRQAIRAGLGGTDAGLHLAAIELAEGDRDAARVALGQHLGQHPDDFEALAFALELASHSNGEDGAAARSLRARLSALPGGRARALEVDARVRAQREGSAAAAALLEDAAKTVDLTRPEHAPALFALQRHLAAAGRSGDALGWARRARAAAPDSASAWAASGLARELAGGSDDAAMADYRAAVAADPEQVEALLGLARLELARGASSAAVDDLLRAHRASRRRAVRGEALLDAALLLAAAGEHHAAVGTLEQLLWEDPVDARAAVRLAEWLRARDPASPRVAELDARARRFGASRVETTGHGAAGS